MREHPNLLQAAVRGWRVRAEVHSTMLSWQLQQSAAQQHSTAQQYSTTIQQAYGKPRLSHSPASDRANHQAPALPQQQEELDSCSSDDEAELLALAEFATSAAASRPATAVRPALGPGVPDLAEAGAWHAPSRVGLHAREEQEGVTTGSTEEVCQMGEYAISAPGVGCTDHSASRDVSSARKCCDDKSLVIGSEASSFEEITVCWPSDDVDSIFADSDDDTEGARSAVACAGDKCSSSQSMHACTTSECGSNSADTRPPSSSCSQKNEGVRKYTASDSTSVADSLAVQSRDTIERSCLPTNDSPSQTSSRDDRGIEQLLSDRELRRRVGCMCRLAKLTVC
jgi:hypothetical protein